MRLMRLMRLPGSREYALMGHELETLLRARASLSGHIAAALGELAVIEAGTLRLARFDEALTHPSYANEAGIGDNQRLEFLGDAVLSVCVSELLIERFPNADEGLLTRMRSALVNAEALASWARSVDLGLAMAFGKGARTGGEREQTNVLADAVEAIVAAVYYEYGLIGARALVLAVALPRMVEETRLASRDPKSELQERVQALGLEAPRYRVRAAHGPEHNALFEIEVLVGELVLGLGEGRSKRIAERKAAEQALAADPEAVLAVAVAANTAGDGAGL
jgi:ribonuclease III